ncbi:hypothetical protein CVT25_001667 [Psilocybe cyanescens]|uniref:F-box domain-containing protein n=1 Tax=Psilocybe cyanescens TaxID=93625 RepID=A0A409X592_PSICY|nr:hypothetical protein CVT25_001667 [Psilocybe cyanescens]
MPYGVQPSLPTELYRPIVENLEHDTATLLVVLLASKTLQLEIERFIYRRMVQKNEINQQKFLTSILESPRRALLVEEYSQEGVSYTAKVRLWSLLCRALNCMQNLKHFTIRTTLITGLPTEFHGRYTFRLKTLDLRGPCSGDKLIITFLQFQTQLDSLSIEWSKTNEQLILPSTCPQLRFLRGNKGAVETFLPGRSIFSLVWVPHPADSTTCVSHLAFAFNNIRTLSYGGFLGCPDLNLIIRHLRSLEILRIVDPTLNELVSLYQLPNLQILILLCQHTRRHYSAPPFANPLDQVIQDMFTSCALLQRIDISVKRSDYEQWTRDQPQVPQITSISYQEMHPWWITPGT